MCLFSATFSTLLPAAQFLNLGLSWVWSNLIRIQLYDIDCCTWGHKAGGVAGMCGTPEHVREREDKLHTAGYAYSQRHSVEYLDRVAVSTTMEYLL